MSIVVRLDRVMVDRKMMSKDLAEEVGDYRGEFIALKKRKGRSNPFFDLRRYL